MGFSRDGLFSSVHAYEEHTVLAAKREIRAFQAREMELDSLHIAVNFAHHAAMDFVVEDGTDGVGANGIRERRGFAVQRLSHGPQRLDANNFGVGQLELTDIHAGKAFSKFTDAVKFLLTSFGEEWVVKFRCDSVDEAAADGQVVLHE